MGCQSTRVRTVAHQHLTGDIINFVPSVSSLVEEILSNYTFSDPDISTILTTYSGDWNSVYSIVLANSASWGGSDLSFILNYISSTSACAASACNLVSFVNSNSANWIYQGNDLKALSANWQITYTTFAGQSANNLTAYNTVNVGSPLWNSGYSTVNSNSATNWNYQGNDLKSLSSNWQNTYVEFASQSANNINTRTTIQNNSAQWALSGISQETDPIFTAWAQANSATFLTQLIADGLYVNVNGDIMNGPLSAPALSTTTLYVGASTIYFIDSNGIILQSLRFDDVIHFKSVYSQVNTLSTNWNTAYSQVNDNAINWNSVYSQVNANSAQWGIDTDNVEVNTFVQSNSARQNNIATTVEGNSANWNYQGTDIKSLTGNWQHTFTTVNSTSANWNSLYSNNNVLSAGWENTRVTFASQSANNISVYTTVNSNSASWGSGSGSTGYIVIQDQKSQNTGGGTFSSGAWRTRDLNVLVVDTTANVSLSANQFTLPSGTYRFTAFVPAYFVSRAQARLQNITDGVSTLLSKSGYTGNNGAVGDTAQYENIIIGRFTINSSKVFEIQHQCEVSRATIGFGVMSNFTTEIYTSIEIIKE